MAYLKREDIKPLVNLPVLVLNQNYEPLNICLVRRALVLILRGKAEALENNSGMLHSVRETFLIPSVVHLIYMVKRPRGQPKLTKFEVFNRDHYTCQYCSKQTKELTLDHVIPKRRGGKHTWENVASACISCNRHKAGHTPSEAKMTLLREPKPPQDNGFYIPHHYLQLHEEWQKYLPQ